MTEKSILEQALLQVNTLEEAVKQNAKGILSSVMKQELNELLKESEEEEEVATEEEAMEPTEEESEDMSEQPDSDNEDEAENADDEEMPSINDEPSKDIDDESPEVDDMPSMDDMPTDDDMLDMTNASDEEVLKVFKAMSDEDGIVVKKDGNNIELKDEDDEYIIKLDESEEEEEEMEVSEDWNEEESMDDVAEGEEEETVYEIELDDEEDSEEEVSEDDSMEVEATEAARTKWNIHGDKNEANRAGLKSKKVFAAGAMNEEVDNLKKQNAEYKKALVLFKEKLNEVAVFNANLAYATRLFTEHSTTKQEKLNILKRFDSISTINESKNLYNSIKAELDTKKPVTESVVEKIANTPSSSSSQEMLAESKAYENPQFRRMKDLMSKLK
jgi:hypothetical protein